jgi:hypothetical protein
MPWEGRGLPAVKLPPQQVIAGLVGDPKTQSTTKLTPRQSPHAGNVKRYPHVCASS